LDTVTPTERVVSEYDMKKWGDVRIFKLIFILKFSRIPYTFFKEEFKVAKVCDICGKKPMTGNNVSHSHKATKRRWLPNLQKVKVKVEGGTKSMRVCTSCIRSGKVK